uniref:G-protein coupled receptors family 3 profile domain-containing protein n=1 Tax=Leptobrachium leishanense TaxID=445787 RepID=A0A8C5PDT9_9ANUR
MMVSVYRALWHIILSQIISTFCFRDQRCGLRVSELSGMTQPGDIMIGVVLPLHVDKVIERISFQEKPPNIKCTDFLFESFQSLQALRFAVEEINGNPDILANITLGYQAYDSCDVVRMDLQGAFQVVSGYDQVIPNFRCFQDVPFSTTIGPSSSTQSILVAHILGLYRYPQLLHYMKKVRVMMSSGRELYFDVTGDPPAVYDIVNWQMTPEGRIRHIKVGSYDTAATNGRVFSINRSEIRWPNKEREVPISVCSPSCAPGFWKAVSRGEPACCFQCVPCPQGEISNQTDSTDCFKCPWDMWPNHQKSSCLPKPIEYLSYEDHLGATMASTSIASSLVPVVILRIFVRYKATPIVKANNCSISCLLLVSLSLCFLCTLAFIGYPEPEKCFLRQPAFGMVFTFCVSSLLAKTVIVVFAFMATKPDSSLRLWTSPWVSYVIIGTCSVLQLLLIITWLSLKPPFPEQNILSKPGVISVECNEGSTIAFWSMFGYLGLLASTSFIVAFMARGLPDSFNEAKFITFSMLSFLSVWVAFIPASLSARGKYTQAMEVFAILASSWALVIFMFLPKCFIILFRPNMNSKGQLMRKN